MTKSYEIDTTQFSDDEEWYNQSGRAYICLQVPEGWDYDDFESIVQDALERRGFTVK